MDSEEILSSFRQEWQRELQSSSSYSDSSNNLSPAHNESLERPYPNTYCEAIRDVLNEDDEFKLLEMDPVELWHQNRVMIVGDSRVRRLKSVSDPVLADNVNFYFSGGIVVDNMISLVDDHLTEDHQIIILMGFIGDEVQKYYHQVTDEGSINLLHSNESDSSAKVIAAVKVAHLRWMAQKPERIIVWTIPYYLDYATYKASRIGEYDVGDTLVTSWDSSRLFVNYVAKLRLQWVTSNPGITFSLLNKVMFFSHNHREMYKLFGSISGKDYNFPTHLLTDGLHPSVALTSSIWKFLLSSVDNVYRKSKSIPTSQGSDCVLGEQLVFPAAAVKERQEVALTSFMSKASKGSLIKRTPYVHRDTFKTYERTLVHSRLSNPDSNYEELLEEHPVGNFGNLSWRSSASNLSQASTSKNTHTSSGSQRPQSSWSWAYHRQVVAETKTSIFTQGVQEQKWAEGRLASIIRERGLRAASDGQIGSINEASLIWAEQARARITDPHQHSKLIQDDVLTSCTIGDEEENLIIKDAQEDDEGIEDDTY